MADHRSSPSAGAGGGRDKLLRPWQRSAPPGSGPNMKALLAKFRQQKGQSSGGSRSSKKSSAYAYHQDKEEEEEEEDEEDEEEEVVEDAEEDDGDRIGDDDDEEGEDDGRAEPERSRRKASPSARSIHDRGERTRRAKRDFRLPRKQQQQQQQEQQQQQYGPGKARRQGESARAMPSSSHSKDQLPPLQRAETDPIRRRGRHRRYDDDDDAFDGDEVETKQGPLDADVQYSGARQQQQRRRREEEEEDDDDEGGSRSSSNSDYDNPTPGLHEDEEGGEKARQDQQGLSRASSFDLRRMTAEERKGEVAVLGATLRQMAMAGKLKSAVSLVRLIEQVDSTLEMQHIVDSQGETRDDGFGGRELPGGDTPLHWACENGQLDFVAFLLEYGAHPDMQDKKGWQPLHVAVFFGHLGICKLLLDAGAETTNTLEDQSMYGHKWRGDETPIHLAVAMRRPDLLFVLLRKSAEAAAAAHAAAALATFEERDRKGAAAGKKQGAAAASGSTSGGTSGGKKPLGGLNKEAAAQRKAEADLRRASSIVRHPTCLLLWRIKTLKRKGVRSGGEELPEEMHWQSILQIAASVGQLGFWLEALMPNAAQFTMTESRDILRQRDHGGRTAIHVALGTAAECVKQRWQHSDASLFEKQHALEADAVALIGRIHFTVVMYLFDDRLESSFPSRDCMGFVEYNEEKLVFNRGGSVHHDRVEDSPSSSSSSGKKNGIGSGKANNKGGDIRRSKTNKSRKELVSELKAMVQGHHPGDGQRQQQQQQQRQMPGRGRAARSDRRRKRRSSSNGGGGCGGCCGGSVVPMDGGSSGGGGSSGDGGIGLTMTTTKNTVVVLRMPRDEYATSQGPRTPSERKMVSSRQICMSRVLRGHRTRQAAAEERRALDKEILFWNHSVYSHYGDPPGFYEEHVEDGGEDGPQQEQGGDIAHAYKQYKGLAVGSKLHVRFSHERYFRERTLHKYKKEIKRQYEEELAREVDNQRRACGHKPNRTTGRCLRCNAYHARPDELCPKKEDVFRRWKETKRQEIDRRESKALEEVEGFKDLMLQWSHYGFVPAVVTRVLERPSDEGRPDEDNNLYEVQTVKGVKITKARTIRGLRMHDMEFLRKPIPPVAQFLLPFPARHPASAGGQRGGGCSGDGEDTEPTLEEMEAKLSRWRGWKKGILQRDAGEVDVKQQVHRRMSTRVVNDQMNEKNEPWIITGIPDLRMKDMAGPERDPVVQALRQFTDAKTTSTEDRLGLDPDQPWLNFASCRYPIYSMFSHDGDSVLDLALRYRMTTVLSCRPVETYVRQLSGQYRWFRYFEQVMFMLLVAGCSSLLVMETYDYHHENSTWAGNGNDDVVFDREPGTILRWICLPLMILFLVLDVFDGVVDPEINWRKGLLKTMRTVMIRHVLYGVGLFCILVLVVLPPEWRTSVTERNWRLLAAVVSILLWVKVLLYMELQPKLGPLVKVIKKMTSEAVKFFIVFFTMHTGFTLAFYVLGGLEKTAGRSHFIQDWLVLITVPLNYFDWEVWYTEGGIVELDYVRDVRVLVFLLWALGSGILLFNVLIAMLNDKYTEVAQRSLAWWKFNRAAYYVRTHRLFRLFRCCDPLYDTRPVYHELQR